MANILRPGFRPIFNGDHHPPLRRGRVADDYDGDLGGSNVDIAVGAPVRLNTDGTFDLAAVTETIWGVVVAIEPHYDATLGAMKYSNTLPNQTSFPAIGHQESRIIVCPVQGGQQFLVQCDDTAAAYDTYAEYVDMIGENADSVHVASQMPTGHWLLDISTNAAASGQWQIVDIPNPELQDFASAYVEVIVVINEGQIAPFSTTGI